MPLELLDHCTFLGPALPEPFVRFELERELERTKLLPKTTGAAGRELQESWDAYRRALRELVVQGGAVRVANHVLQPLVQRLGYDTIEASDSVSTREGVESGGVLMRAPGGGRLRVWPAGLDEDLDAPSRRGAAYRYSHARIAQRVLLATNERVGILTNGTELRILISDPARPESQIVIPIDPHWKRSRDVPDSYRLLLALASPKGVASIPDLVEKARFQQTRVTKELRRQARQAVEGFVQELLDHPDNRGVLAEESDREALARQLWREGLVIIYRLLFVLKLESVDDPARGFRFASTSLWRNSFSPSVALAPIARSVLDDGIETGAWLESGLRNLFSMFCNGLECTELHVTPLGGALFGEGSIPLISRLRWGERSVAWLLDRLLWTPKARGQTARERVHYGSLDVEDLGRVYEALLELEPGIASDSMCRLRRQKLEVVVPIAQGERYRPADPVAANESEEADEDAEEETNDYEAPATGRRTRVEWIEAIPPGRFYLRVGLGRKASGSYYTPHSFVRFLVQETLGPQVAERSPKENPNPAEILKLKVLDPAMGSGHFLVEACRFLGEKLYEACRLCDERALAAETRAERVKAEAERGTAIVEAEDYRQRIIDLPDPDNELLRYLPSRVPEGSESGFSQKKAEALCRRLVAVHCLYGVDKNPLAVELAKLSLWIESHAEGLPLTFVDHRVVVGDSLTGPFWEKLIFRPGNPEEPIAGLFHQDLDLKLQSTLREAIRYVGRLEATVGATVAEMMEKETLKADLDRALLPFRIAAAAWSGGVMLGPEECDDSGYADVLRTIGNTAELPERVESDRLRNMIAVGLGVDEVRAERGDLYAVVKSGSCVPALPYDLTFPEVFYPTGVPHGRRGFSAVLGNPPWDRMLPADKEFFAAFEFAVLDAPARRERDAIQQRLLAEPRVRRAYEQYIARFRGDERALDTLYQYQVAEVDGERTIGKQDAFRAFMERNVQLLGQGERTGVVVPSAFHANEGATGVRRLYLEKNGLTHCYSFENRRKLFEIDSRFKFATVVTRAGTPTDSFDCAFYLHDDEWLFGDRSGHEALQYTLDFVRRTGGEYLSLLELRSQGDLEVAELCFANGEPFGDVCERLHIRLGRELNMTDDAWRFTPTAEVLPNGGDPRDPDVAARLLEMGYFVLHEGKTFWQFDDRWGERPRSLVSLARLEDRGPAARAARYYRAAYRDIASATNERTLVYSMLCPGCVIGDTAKAPERDPHMRSNASMLAIVAVCDSFATDFLVRLRATSHVSLFILNATPLPAIENSLTFLAHAGLRLTSNHSGYAPLWREQLGDTWRESKPLLTWPVLATDDERWEVRAAIDPVVADAYGLNREQYAHVLSTFSHASYRRAPELCLAKFDELKEIGLDAFTKKYDPYWNVPLNENLPQPVIDLPVQPEKPVVREQAALFGDDVLASSATGRRRGKARRA